MQRPWGTYKNHLRFHIAHGSSTRCSVAMSEGVLVITSALGDYYWHLMVETKDAIKHRTMSKTAPTSKT